MRKGRMASKSMIFKSCSAVFFLQSIALAYWTQCGQQSDGNSSNNRPLKGPGMCLITPAKFVCFTSSCFGNDLHILNLSISSLSLRYTYTGLLPKQYTQILLKVNIRFLNFHTITDQDYYNSLRYSLPHQSFFMFLSYHFSFSFLLVLLYLFFISFLSTYISDSFIFS